MGDIGDREYEGQKEKRELYCNRQLNIELQFEGWRIKEEVCQVKEKNKISLGQIETDIDSKIGNNWKTTKRIW